MRESFAYPNKLHKPHERIRAATGLAVVFIFNLQKMRRIFIVSIIVFILAYSCRDNSNRNIINVTNIEKKLHKGMTKSSVLNKFGVPKDSIMSEKYLNYFYIYDTNDFTGYTLKIWFNKEQEVINFRVD